MTVLRSNFLLIAASLFVAGAFVSSCGDDEPEKKPTTQGPCQTADGKAVTCGMEGLSCDPADGQCKCGGPGGVVCGEGEACVLEPSPTCISDRCSGLPCNRGQSCDPADGICKCGGAGGSICTEAQTCNAGTRTCSPGLCDEVSCNRGQSCDPADGQCKCGGIACGPGERCEPGGCVVAELCAEVTCDEGATCDPDDGICKCGTTVCSFGQQCEAGECVANRCAGVHCGVGAACNPGDGLCHCGGPDGSICASGEACAEDAQNAGAFACKGTNLCADADVRCGAGTTCDPSDGTCRCGGIGSAAPICGPGQSCDLAKKLCRGGDRCLGLTCDAIPGTSCDPEDGLCKCGGLGGTVCATGELCAPVEEQLGCRAPCNAIVGAECTKEEGCYYDGAIRHGYCAPAGNQSDGGPCTTPVDCRPGFHCVAGETSLCRKYCRVSANPSECATGRACIQLSGAPNDVGVCLTVGN